MTSGEQMDQGKFEDLIARLEAATEGSAELDSRIHVALHPDQTVLIDPGSVGPQRREPEYGRLADFPLDGWSDYEAVARSVGATPCTTSIDAAALTLVPEGCRYTIEQSICGRWFDAMVFKIGEADEFIGDTETGVKTAALALCIAALRARMKE